MDDGGAGTQLRQDAPATRRAMLAVYVAFIGNGFTFACWASRIPQVRDQLHLSAGELGLLLLSLSAGSVLALPLAGLVVTRLGNRRTVVVTALISASGLATIAAGYRVGWQLVAVGLFAIGLGNATWDVAMNVEGAAVEQLLGRSIMSRFHAGWSIGTVAAAGVGAALVALHVTVTVHLLVAAVVVAAVIPLAARNFLAETAPAKDPARGAGPADRRRSPFQAWTEPRTLLIGLFVLTAAFSEGTGNDWLGVATIDGYHTSAVVGSLSFALFLTAMTTGRWLGPHFLDRWGRVPMLRASAALATVGLLLVVVGQSLALALVGVVCWGVGTALGFPTGMSAAADDPAHAAARVSVVASIGYTAFLAGPPAIGLLTDYTGILPALSLAAGLIAVGMLVVGSLRPLAGTAVLSPPGAAP